MFSPNLKKIIVVLALGIAILAIPLSAYADTAIPIQLFRPLPSSNQGTLELINNQGDYIAISWYVYRQNFADSYTLIDRQSIPDVGLFFSIVFDSSTRTVSEIYAPQQPSGFIQYWDPSLCLNLQIVSSGQPNRLYNRTYYDPNEIGTIDLSAYGLEGKFTYSSFGSVSTVTGNNFAVRFSGAISANYAYRDNNGSLTQISSSINITDTVPYKLVYRNDILQIEGKTTLDSTAEQNTAMQNTANQLRESAQSLHDLADSLDVARPSVDAGIPQTPVQLDNDNALLTSVGTLWSNDIILTLSIVSLSIALISILLRGTNG